MSKLLEYYEYLHAHPELSKQEFRTAEFLMEALSRMGYSPVRVGATGVYADLIVDQTLPWVMLRSDMDALPVTEETGVSYASQNPGVMHACGHDSHMAMLLSAAEELKGKALPQNIRFLFQPAEEGVRGAKSIVEKGHLDGVDYFIGSHLTKKPEGDPSDFAPGSYGSLATTKYDVIFHGLAAHAGGAPQAGKNAMLAAATAVLNLYAIPRHNDGATRINVGRLIAGSGRNVICDEAKLEIEVRGATTKLNDYVSQYAERILKSAADMHDCTMEIRLMGASESQTSDEDFCMEIHKICMEKLGLVPVSAPLIRKNGGSEDVAYMMNRVQEQGGKASFMRLMTTMSAPGHNRRYDFDESVLKQGVKAFAGMALYLLSEE
jgi:aminobenzoyl-glutamate utilization protein A